MKESSHAPTSRPREQLASIPETSELRDRGNAALREARRLARYGGRDDERTKPAVTLLDYTGDDEVTVRWENVRRDTPATFEIEAMAPRPRVSARTAGVTLGAVFGGALSICIVAFLSPGRVAQAPAAQPIAQVPDVLRARVPVTPPANPSPGPVVTPLGAVVAARPPAPRPHRAHTSLNMDALPRASVVLDGQPIGDTPRRVVVTPGEHTVSFVHPELGTQTMTVLATKDRVTFAKAKF